MIPSEGVIKFKYQLKPSKDIEEKDFIEIEKWRAILFKMGLIGEYPIEKVGYGNISKRLIPMQESFIITGTQTGKLPHLNGSHYTKIIKSDLKKMSLTAIGPIAPSSESLTHHAIYHTNQHINYIFHIHSEKLWNYMLENNFEATPDHIEYGTNEMANAAQSCIAGKEFGIFAMAGHQDGIMAYGTTAEQTGKVILDLVKVFNT